MNVWVWIVGAAVQSTVSVLVSMYWRRAIHRNNVLIEQVLTGVEGAVVTYTKGTRVNLREYRKAIAAAMGVIFIGLLTWVETTNLEPLIGPLFPAEARPLVGVILGGIVSVAGVILAKNQQPAVEPAPATVEVSPTIAERRTIESLAHPVTVDTPFWSDVQPTDTVSDMTSKVQLQPVPAAGN